MARVEIRGLRGTRRVVVTRELSVRPGEALDWSALRRDRLRLLDLGLFAEVQMSAERDSTLGRPVLLVAVAERPTWLAYPVLEYDEEDGIVYGLHGSGINLRGRNERASLTLLAGGRRRISAGWSTPWFAGRRLGTGIGAYASRRENTGEDLDQEQAGVSLSVSPRKGRRMGFPVEFGVERVIAEPTGNANPPADPQDETIDDDHRWLRTGFWRDTREYRARPMEGAVAAAYAEVHGGPLGGDTDFQRYRIDLAKVFPTGGASALTAASRVVWSRGPVPRYLRLHLGGAATLRGHPLSAYGGESRWSAWVEQRIPILPKRTFSVLKGRYTVDWTLDGAVFVDAGSVWEGSELEHGRARARFGAGAGLRLVVPFVDVASFDIATDGRGVRVHARGGVRL